MKIEGKFTILIDGKIVAESENHMFYKGARFILSFLRNELVADLYGAGVFPDWIHYGVGDKALDPTDWHLESFTNAIQISATGGTTFTIAGTTYDHVCRFWAVLPAAGNVYVSELGLGLTTVDPATEADYPNAVLDRAVLIPTQTKPDGSTMELRFDLTINLT